MKNVSSETILTLITSWWLWFPCNGVLGLLLSLFSMISFCFRFNEPKFFSQSQNRIVCEKHCLLLAHLFEFYLKSKKIRFYLIELSRFSSLKLFHENSAAENIWRGVSFFFFSLDSTETHIKANTHKHPKYFAFYLNSRPNVWRLQIPTYTLYQIR